MRASLFAILALMMASAASAATIETPLSDPAREQRARSLFHELRCVVCEGQSVADSDAVLAAQMRAQVRSLLAEGKTDADVLTYFRSRYGESILMTPPLRSDTLLLWLAPLLLLAAGGGLIWRFTRAPHEGNA
jgi:cytochrome c-type biogenesis protein CcmH